MFALHANVCRNALVFFSHPPPLYYSRGPYTGPLGSMRAHIWIANVAPSLVGPDTLNVLGSRSSSAIFSACLRRSCVLPIALLHYVHVHVLDILLPAQPVRVRSCALYLALTYFMERYAFPQYVSAS